MKLQKENLGKVAITIDKDYWDVNKDYDKLVVVQVKDKFATYISRKPVPMGTMVTNREYWIPFSSLKEDIVLDYNSFLERYGEELAFLHENVDRMDEIMKASENIMATHDKIKEDADYIKYIHDRVNKPNGVLLLNAYGKIPTNKYSEQFVVGLKFGQNRPRLLDIIHINTSVDTSTLFHEYIELPYALYDSNETYKDGIIKGEDLKELKLSYSRIGQNTLNPYMDFLNAHYINDTNTIKDALLTLDRIANDTSGEIKEVRNNIPQTVDTKIAEIVGAAPETLDTLEEIANKLHDNDDIHQSILAAIGEKVSNTTYTNYITQAERAMTAMNDKITELEGKLLVFESGAKLSLSISPSVIYKNTATNVTVAGRLNSSVELGDVALQLNGFAQIATGTNTVTKTESINDSNNTKTFTLKANVKGVQLTTSASLQLRNAIYCGFGSTANDIIKVLNRLSARTSASGIYGGTNTIGDNKHYIICVPNDVPALNNFTMGGAPYVMNHTTQTINEITYNVYISGATYNNQALVEIIAS